jgi:phosphate transport system substrate-binding protein
MKFATLTSAAALVLSTVVLASGAQARDQIRIVGSSTVYPFTTAVAEQLGKTGVKTPVVESTGTGGGMKLFCAGVGVDHPDASNASRRIKKGEFETCQKNGVTDIVEIKVGFDGIVVANAKSGADLNLTKKQLFLALDPGRRRQARRQPEQELERHRHVAAEREDRGSRPAADLRHARRVP